MTISLALGMREMVKRHALVRKLASVETLGSATVICSDKTGTLTQNVMTVTRLWVDGQTVEVTGTGYTPKGDFRIDGKEVDLQKLPGITTVLWVGALNNDSVMEPVTDGAKRLPHHRRPHRGSHDCRGGSHGMRWLNCPRPTRAARKSPLTRP